MLKMLNRSDVEGALEVDLLLSDHDLCDSVQIRLAKGRSVMCCLDTESKLKIKDITDSSGSVHRLQESYTDFCWEDLSEHDRQDVNPKLLTVDSQCSLRLYGIDPHGQVSLVCESPSDTLLESVKDNHSDVSELRTVRLLSFMDGRCVLLVNSSVVLQIRWTEDSSHLSSCRLGLPPQTQDECVDYHLCRGILFLLFGSGVTYVFDSTDGKLMATVDLPSYCGGGQTDADFSPPVTFCRFQISHDLNAAVTVTCHNQALAVDLNDYFRVFPDHLCCRAAPDRPLIKPVESWDHDSLLSSAHSLSVLDTPFQTDRSWESRLSSLYIRSKAPARPAHRLPWYKDFPHVECRRASATAKLSQPSVKPGGAVMCFHVPEGATAAMLTVSEFSAVVTFVSPGNTTLAYWDLEGESVTYHRTETPAVPVQRSDEEHQCLLLKGSGLSAVLFCVTQEELLNRLMVFGTAGTVDSLCHLNAWGRCSIPIHALQAGLKNHQLDTVDFFLKSKENILSPTSGFVLPDQASAVSSQTQLRNIHALCPALDLLHSAIQDTHTEAQSRQFCEQLLSITLTFLNTQTRVLLTGTHELDVHLQECVRILDGYISDLRGYMKKFPWPDGGAAETPACPHTPTSDAATEREWQSMSDEEVVQRAVLSRRIPHAQAFLRRRCSVECSLEDVRKTGLRRVFTCLTRRDLQTAEMLLANMAFNVKEQLHSICVHTADRDLRAFMVEELQRQSYLSPGEVKQVEFIKTIETLCSTPATRCSNPLDSSRVLQMTRSDPESRRLLEEIVQDPARSSSRSLLDCVRLDWIRCWDTDAQSSVLLSRLQDSTLGSCDAVTLWSYLTCLHDWGRVTAWVCSMTARDTETTAAPRWPALTPHIINSYSHCGEYMRNQILDLLAPQGLFVQSEMDDFEQLLWRLGQAGGVMRDGSGPPVPQFLSSQGQEFHQRFILHCLENSLQYLLYTYLEHYRLTPGNCPGLDDRNLFESFPWFEMMLKLQRIPRDLKDPERVFQASLTGAQVLLPGSQASISSMLLEGHSLLALSTIMFRPGGIDQAMREGERGQDPLSRVDPQLLRMALGAYPKLKTALFPQIGPRGASSCDISLYHLMQSLQPLDPSRLFSWQAGNVAGGTETSSEPPHFSSPHLVSRHSLIENLDYLYYLSHRRPAFAYGVFLTQHLVNCSNVKSRLSQAVEQVFSLALLNFSSASVTAACVCFCELLGVCSLKLRVDLKALNLILKLWSRNYEDGAEASFRQMLVEKAGKLVSDEKHTAQELLVHLEEAVRDALETKGVGRSSYEAAQDWALPVKFCHLHALPLSSAYPQDCACDGQWINFLLFVQLHSYPPQQVRSLAAGFSPALQAHISLAFQDLPAISPHTGLEEQGTVRDDNPEASGELFQVLLKSQEKASPWRYLLSESVRHHSPALSVLAACHQGAELLQCLCVWILTSVEDEISEEATAHIDENPSHHVWNLHDLSILWKTLLHRSKIRPLIRGFQLFQRESPLIYMLNMYELCYDYKDYQRGKDKLLHFQKCLLNLRSSSVVLSCDVLPVQWVESQASVLLLVLLKQSRTQYELRRLLQLLVDMERLLKSNGPDFKKLSQLSQVLSDTPVPLSPCLLEDYSTSALQGECRKMLEQLQDTGLFTQARKVAQLAELPVDCLIINELLRDLSALKAKRQWDRQETRLGFWRKCHHQLKTDCVDPETACQFFLSQAEEPLQSDSEVIQLQERCLLLGLAGHWLSCRESPLPVLRLAQLEKRQWEYRIRWLVLRTALERESLFAPSALSEDSFENLLKEFSFSKMAVVNDQAHLSLEGLPASEDDCALSEQDRKALSALVGQLLNEGSVNEASRVCRYFGSFHRDMWLVLRCRGLACGELQPGLPELHSPDGESRRSLPSSPSTSSLSSFVVVSSPEDAVLVQLKQLVDQCCHGKSYCKQVLSLYELSKELQCTYAEISSEEPEAVLRKVLLSQQSDRCKKAQAFISVQGLRSDAVAQLISSAVVDGLLSSSHEGQTGERLMYGPVDSREEFIQLAKLCGDPNLVGSKLLEIISTVPLSELSCTVEILILAHDCFSLTCNMEGIVRVLQAARHLSHTHLAHGEGYGLLVRLLTGIGRYNDMTYIFDLLHQNHRFEMLLRKKVESNVRLKTALLDYIKRCLPGDSEKHNMVALCFSMCREIGENHEAAARTQLKIIESQPWAITGDLKNTLVKVLTLLKDAAESYSKDSCVRQAVKCVKMAKLVTLQLHFLNHGQELRVINLRPSDLQSAIVSLPRCYQAFVLAEAYDHSPDWAEVLFQKIIVNGEFGYLEEFKRHRSLPTSLFEEISKKMLHHKPPASSSQNLKRLLSHCEDVYTHYKLAYEHKFLDVANMLLQDSKTNGFLNDRLGT
ncbi:spatacsin isoform X1 [Triplophysa rosa]|uniref:Spatacsin-like n=2 Tax=Triplophysa rosa TaxID=992332 RepID=A0A9W7WZD2_TRIRA|nr:spatacsin isoform X1 [Triplophysa rosa]XP_057186265.1 spatacsin isoform X1 [Triplophysa rosa]XP_057186266.1 spatacsin isoform X1 [Triplophysa rosa]XP_057186267.1 spatacsin isoform X1 [Triplophysa rosa]XP_057186268.1 spatacsin isoform X1 [Triplophysa rosa]XP_057186269.1 spatacsin isoform X1 [Triplophysa rosa]XP_057186270.1 spatacsin isoform X1 [Triplophysa rosa]XP_057186271.1 spatacsin isoform X1 [Triplophysa rosa]XP_057186273.1 spatacsin isoform X1 [Triplophysa rosa]XP_057186274.1 spata